MNWNDNEQYADISADGAGTRHVHPRHRNHRHIQPIHPNIRHPQVPITQSTKPFLNFPSPTLTSCKWWPGGLGKTANFCVVVARLVTLDTDHGIHIFLVQLRDMHTHEPLPGTWHVIGCEISCAVRGMYVVIAVGCIM